MDDDMKQSGKKIRAMVTFKLLANKQLSPDEMEEVRVGLKEAERELAMLKKRAIELGIIQH